MPRLARLGNTAIRIFAADHNPPHIHLDSPSGKILVEIGSWRVIAGTWHRDHSEALDWAKEKEAILIAKWKDLNG